MEREKADELLTKVEKLESEGASQEVLDKVLAEMREVALQEGNAYLAKVVSKKLNDFEGLKKAGDLGLKRGNLHDALDAYSLIEDEEGLRKGIDLAIKQKGIIYLLQAIPEDLEQKIGKGYQSFLKDKGFERAFAYELHKVINAANELASNYDVSVGIAKSGLFSAYIFSLFDLPTIAVGAHRRGSRGKGATFKWLDSPEQIKNSKVLVFDKDVITGRTLRRVLKEIQKYSPKSVDLFLNHDAIRPNVLGIGFIISAVPEGFGKIFYPKIMDYNNFYDGVLKVKEKLKET